MRRNEKIGRKNSTRKKSRGRNRRLRLEILKAVDRIGKLETKNENTARTAAEKQFAKTTFNAFVTNANGLDGGSAQGYQNGPTTEQGNSARNAPIGKDNPQKKTLMWAQIAKLQRPVQVSIPSTLLEKIKISQSVLDQQQTRVRMELRPTAACFKNVQRGPIGVIRRTLSECFPMWSILGLCFMGGSILEVVTNIRQKNRLTATLKIMGIVEVPDFDIAKATKKRQMGQKTGDAEDRNPLAQKAAKLLL